MAYLTQLDAQLLLFIHDALHHEPLHNFWAGISLLVLDFYRRRFNYKPQNAQRWHCSSCGTAVKHVCQQCYF